MSANWFCDHPIYALSFVLSNNNSHIKDNWRYVSLSPRLTSLYGNVRRRHLGFTTSEETEPKKKHNNIQHITLCHSCSHHLRLKEDLMGVTCKCLICPSPSYYTLTSPSRLPSRHKGITEASEEDEVRSALVAPELTWNFSSVSSCPLWMCLCCVCVMNALVSNTRHMKKRTKGEKKRALNMSHFINSRKLR